MPDTMKRETKNSAVEALLESVCAGSFENEPYIYLEIFGVRFCNVRSGSTKGNALHRLILLKRAIREAISPSQSLAARESIAIDALWKIHDREWASGSDEDGARHASEMWEISDVALARIAEQNTDLSRAESTQ